MIVLKLLKESLFFAIAAIVSNKVRTILTLLGITIGIFSVIAVFTVFDSLESKIKNSFEEMGNNVLFVQKWPWYVGNGEYPWWKYIKRPEPSLDDLKAIQTQKQSVAAAVLMAGINATITRKSKSLEEVEVRGVTHQYPETNAFDIYDGRYFSEMESAIGNNVVIIGFKIYESLFPEGNAVGKFIKIKGRKMQVIGVFKEEGESMIGESSDNLVIIPINVLRKMINLRNMYGIMMMVKAKEGVSMDKLRMDILKSLRRERRLKPGSEENFAINQIDFLTKSLDSIFNTISIAGWIIGGFSLLVGGFGIANIMFVSVSERTKQIGIQKALGAKKYFILLQFLFESVFLAIMGGIVGLGLVYLGTIIVNYLDIGVDLFLSYYNIMLAIIVSSAIGLVAGMIPARRAAHLDPVEAMRAV